MSLKTIIQQIKSATLPGENTALRVGSALEQMDSAKRDKSDSLSASETINMLNTVKLLAATGTPFLGAIDPATTIPAGNFWAFASEGTYANAGGIVVGTGEIAIITRVGATFDSIILDVPVKSIVDVQKTSTVGLVDTYTITYTDGSTPTTFEVKNGSTPSPNLRLWSDLPFSKDEQVVKDSVIYIALQNVLATDVPGVSAKWVPIGGSVSTNAEFKAKAEDKAMSPKQFFDVIGDIDFNPVTNVVSMDLPYAGFDVANQSQNTAGGYEFWGWSPDFYANIPQIAIIKTYYKSGGAKKVRIFDKANLANYTDVDYVAVEGVNTVTLNTPVNGANVLIGITGGGMGFNIHGGIATAGIIGVSGVNPNPTVSIGLQVYGGVVTDNFDTIVDRLEKLENSENWSNVLYNSLSEGVVPESGGTNYTENTNGITLNSSGNGNGLIIQKLITLNKRYLQLHVKFSANTVFYVGQASVENPVGKAFATIDSVSKKITIYELDTATVPAFTADIPFNITEGRDYYIKFFKIESTIRIEFIDCVTGLTAICEGIQGGQWDMYKYGYISSNASPIIKSVKIIAITADQPYIMFDGDSITQGDIVSQPPPIYYRDRFADLIGNKLNKAYLVSARSSGRITGVLARLELNIGSLKPKYFCVTIGTNNGNTLAYLNLLADTLKDNGIELILNTVPLYDNTTAAKNAMILQIVNERKLKCIRMDIATSVNGDGVTKDDSCFANEGGTLIHPNVKGNKQIYERAKLDLQEIFIECGAY